MLVVIGMGSEVVSSAADDQAPNSQTQRLSGIAFSYVGDRGIEADPSVIFAEDFEQPTLDAIAERLGHRPRS